MASLSGSAVTELVRLVDDLANGNLRSLVADGRIGRLTSDEVVRAIHEYGRTLVPLPEGWVDLVQAYEVTGKPGHFSLDIPLWTAEEGRSDLTLSVSMIADNGAVRVSIDDLHVL